MLGLDKNGSKEILTLSREMYQDIEDCNPKRWS